MPRCRHELRNLGGLIRSLLLCGVRGICGIFESKRLQTISATLRSSNVAHKTLNSEPFCRLLPTFAYDRSQNRPEVSTGRRRTQRVSAISQSDFFHHGMSVGRSMIHRASTGKKNKGRNKLIRHHLSYISGACSKYFNDEGKTCPLYCPAACENPRERLRSTF